MKIFIGTDHAGYELKEKIKTYLSDLDLGSLGYEVVDKGAFAYDKDDDYPDFITPVAKAVAEDAESFGIILGSSGEGEAMCANRIPGVRADVFYGQVASPENFEIVKLAREHNNANILSLGAKFISEDEAKFAVELFLKTKFSGDERHVRRLAKF